jgi:AsmA-like protein
MKRRKWFRRIVYASAGLSLLLAVLAAVVPELARRHLEITLRDAIGGPVEIGRVGLSLRRIEVRGFRVLDAATPPHPWLSIDRAVFDLTLWQALRGRGTPKKISVDGLVARFELEESLSFADDFSLWKGGFAFPFELVDIRNARLEISLANQPTLIVDRIGMTARGPTESIRVEGSIGGSLGGEWQTSARINGLTLETNCTLSTENLRFTTDGLARLPLVPPNLNEIIRADGVTSARVAFSHSGGAGSHYRIEFSPRSPNVALPTEELALADAECDVTLEDGVLEIHDLRGRLAGGELTLSGRLDMNGPEWPGQIQGRATGLSLNELPDAWQLPAEIHGVATGILDLGMEVTRSAVLLQGTAQISLDQATVFDISTKPIRLDIDLQKLVFDDWKNPPTVEGDMNVRVEAERVDLPQILDHLATYSGEQPIPVTGQVDLTLDLDLPLETLSDLDTCQATGKLSSEMIRHRRMTLRDINTPLAYRNGVLSLADATAVLGDTGEINGSLTVPLFKPDRITAGLRCERIPLRELSNWLSEDGLSIDGEINGNLQAKVFMEGWQDLAAWQVEGTFNSPRLAAADILISEIVARIALSRGNLEFDGLQGTWADATIRGHGTIAAATPHAYRAELRIHDLDLARIAQSVETGWPDQLRGDAKINCVAQGTLEPFDWRCEGNADLASAMIGEIELEVPTCDWSATPSQLEVTSLRVQLFDGEIELSAQVPLGNRTPSQVAGSFRNLQVSPLAGLLPTMPIAFTGTTSGDLFLTGFEDPARIGGTVRFRGLGAKAGSVVVEEIGGTATLSRSRVDFDLTGETLGGRLGFRGEVGRPSATDETALSGSLTIRGVDASRLAVALEQPSLRPLQAILDGDLELNAQGPSFQPSGQGRLLLRDVGWRGNRITREVRSRATLRENILNVQGISFGLAEGTALGEVALQLDRPGTGSFVIQLQRLRTDSLLASRRAIADEVKVRLDATMRGQFAPHAVNAVGEVRLSQGQIGGVPVRDVSGPVACVVDPVSGKGEVQVRLRRGELAGGRLSGDVKMQFGTRLGVDGRVKFTGIELRPLARAVPRLNDRLTGRVSGEANLKGRNLASLGELSGEYRLSLSDSPVLLLPVFNALADTHGIVPSSQQFSKTEIEGRLHRGVLGIDRMTMVASGVHMFVEGTITTRGQLNLDVTADTGELLAVSVAVGLLRPMDLVRRRLIFLNLGGTARRPIVTPDVDRFVQQEVLLFFFPFVIQ